MAKFYVVWVGRHPGVYDNWEEARGQVEGFAGARYKSFPTRPSALAALKEGPNTSSRQRFLREERTVYGQSRLIRVEPPIVPSIAVDAACSGNPGPLEYRAVVTETGKPLFERGPFENGTNNIGEFLAIVEALQYCQKKNLGWPIYSDSRNALKWVKEKMSRTALVQDESNRPLFKRIAHAEKWLKSHSYPNGVLKWQTEEWGEIPADYGRK